MRFDRIIRGDCKEELPALPEDSIDAIVTDPPAGIAFMGKEWDKDRGGRKVWITWMTDIASECLRVIKPGGHALVWALPRTSHWTGMAWEEAGWEPRDKIAHVFGSGFPKSLSIDKAIDRLNGRNLQYPDFGAYLRERRLALGLSMSEIDRKMGTNTAYSWWEGRLSGVQLPIKENYLILKDILNLDDRFDELIERIEAERNVIGNAGYTAPTELYQIGESKEGTRANIDITAPATSLAKQWAGFGTALKPAHEDWWLFRKPLDGRTIAENIIKWGVGGLNIDGCRVGFASQDDEKESKNKNQHRDFGSGQRDNMIYGKDSNERTNYNAPGRFPANLILSYPEHSPGKDSVLRMFPQSSITGKRTAESKAAKVEGTNWLSDNHESQEYADSGSTARFFQHCLITEEDLPPLIYQAKASRAERNGSTHPTMKPLALMRYLCRLITPPGGIILDPFAGSGTTGLAAIQEGFHYILIEQSEEYCEIATRRIFPTTDTDEDDLWT